MPTHQYRRVCQDEHSLRRDRPERAATGKHFGTVTVSSNGKNPWSILATLAAVVSAGVAFFMAIDAKEAGDRARAEAKRALEYAEQLSESTAKLADTTEKARIASEQRSAELLEVQERMANLESLARIRAALEKYGNEGYKDPEPLNRAIELEIDGLSGNAYSKLIDVLARKALHLSTFLALGRGFPDPVIGALDNTQRQYNQSKKFRSNADEIWWAFNHHFGYSPDGHELGDFRVVRQVVTDLAEVHPEDWNKLKPRVLLVHLNSFFLEEKDKQIKVCKAWKESFSPFINKIDDSIPLIVYTRRPYTIEKLAWILQDLSKKENYLQCTKYNIGKSKLKRKGTLGFFVIEDKPRHFSNEKVSKKLFDCMMGVLEFKKEKTKDCTIH